MLFTLDWSYVSLSISGGFYVCIKSVGGQRQFVSVSKSPRRLRKGDAPYGKAPHSSLIILKASRLCPQENRLNTYVPTKS